MKNILLPLVLLFVFLANNRLFGQNSYELKFEQPPELKADAGDDTTIYEGESTILGGNPVASGGTGTYFYEWEPSEGFDGSIANPEIRPSDSTNYTLVVTDENSCSDTSSVKVSVITETGVEKGVEQYNLTIYPNPSKGQFFISLKTLPDNEKIIMRFINSRGESIRHKKISNPSTVIEKHFNINHLGSGIYILKIEGDNFSTTRKLIVR